MAPEIPVHHQEADAEVRVRKLGVPGASLLSGAILYGYSEAENTTSNDPRLLPSWIRYGRATGKLRDDLGDGWLIRRQNGYESTVRDDGVVAIVVALWRRIHRIGRARQGPRCVK